MKHGWDRFVDPEREQRIKVGAARLNKILAEERREFALDKAVAAAGIDVEDLNDVTRSVYSQCVDRAWRDFELTEAEVKSLSWVGSVLRISPAVIELTNKQKCDSVFGTILGQAIDDGRIDDDEHRRLTAVARWAGTTVRKLVQDFFVEFGESFLRGIFAAATEDGRLNQDEWQQFLQSAERLGFSRAEANSLVAPFSRRFVEHVLADAKSDGRLSAVEERTLFRLLNQFELSPEFRRHVTTEVARMRVLTQIAEGILPVLTDCRDVELRAGELVHFRGQSVYMQERQRKSGTIVEEAAGTLVITDSRAVFTSSTKSFMFGHISILSIRDAIDGVEIRAGSKGTGFYTFPHNDRLPAAIWRAAVGRGNQTLVAKVEGSPTRHIPREIRQRIWVRYGGRCAECQAEDYLEFDHIVPVAKGGSNSDSNVQLLCRRCNLRKSDKI